MTLPPSKVDPKRYEYERLRAAERGQPYQVDPASTRRKVEALAWLGWSLADITATRGMAYQTLQKSLARTKIRRATWEMVDAFYRQHEMMFKPDSPWARRQRARAVKLGFRPPLAWEDIEAGILSDVLAKRGNNTRPRDEYDPAEVDYALQYNDFSRRTNHAERVEIFRRWVAAGKSKASLERLSGWNAKRYKEAS